MAIYETLQAILEEAGLSHAVLAEIPAGSVDGINKVFVTSHKPLTDSNYNDTITPLDVVVYVNSIPVRVVAVDPPSGAITLSVAPAVDAQVLIDYRYSPILLQEVQSIREEVQDTIDKVMGGVDTVPYSPVPGTIKRICRTFAAGVLLARDYGFNAEAENTSKDGDAKIKRAEKWLKDYFMSGGNSATPSNTEIEDVAVTSSGDMFCQDRPRQHHDEDCDDDDLEG